MTSVLGSAKARKQSMAVSGLLRVEKKEAGNNSGQKEQAPEAFPQRQSQHVEVGAFQLSFPRLSSAGSHTASTAPLGLILHFFLGALDFISFYKALILRNDERRRGDKDEEKKRIKLSTHSMALRHY